MKKLAACKSIGQKTDQSRNDVNVNVNKVQLYKTPRFINTEGSVVGARQLTLHNLKLM